MSESNTKKTVGAADKGTSKEEPQAFSLSDLVKNTPAEEKGQYGLNLRHANFNSDMPADVKEYVEHNVPTNVRDYIEHCVPPGPVKDALKEAVLREERVNITPDESTANKIVKQNKPAHACLTELVDNSIDARTESQLRGEEDLNISIFLDPKMGGAIRIVDNARGMTAIQLQNAFRLGHSDKAGKRMRGLYGFGLKSSSIALGPTVEVVSQPETGAEKYAVRYDPSDIKGWEISMKTMAAIPGQHGTEIIIPKRKVMITPKFIDFLRKELGSVYFNELNEGHTNITIYYGSKGTYKVTPQDHKYVKTWAGEVMVRGHPVKFMVGVIDEPRSVRETLHGLEIYYNNRKIETGFRPHFMGPKGKIIGLSDHPSMGKVFGRIFATEDSISVNLDKTQAIRDEDFEEMNQKISQSEELAEAKKLARKKREEELQDEHQVSEETRLDIENKMNTVMDMPNGKRRDISDPKGAETGETDVGRREPPADHPGGHPPGDGTRPHNERKRHIRTRRIRSQKLGKFNLRFEVFPEHEKHMTHWSNELEDDVVELIINTGHKCFLGHSDPYLYAFEEAAVALFLGDVDDMGVENALGERGRRLNDYVGLAKSEFTDDEDADFYGDNRVPVTVPDEV